jgi:hypothetical protein
MRIRPGYNLTYECPQSTPMLLVLEIHPSRRVDLLTEQIVRFDPPIESRAYIDGFGAHRGTCGANDDLKGV